MRRLLITLVFILLAASAVQAQIDTCPAEVETALDLVAESCDALGRNQACYGHELMQVELRDGSAPFSTVGDITAAADLLSVHTAPLSLETGDWGIVIFRVQANLPDTLPGQNVTLLFFGDAEVRPQPDAPPDFNAPMQAFQLVTGVGDEACRDVPLGGLLVQNPHEQTVTLLINGFELHLGSTALFTAAHEDKLTITTLEGNVQVVINDTVQDVPAGFTLTVTQDTPPEQPEAAPEVMALPAEALPEALPQTTEPGGEITGLLRCANTGGVDVPAGSTLALRGGWADYTLADVLRFAASNPTSMDYDGASVPLSYRTGPSPWTGSDGAEGFQVNWFWVVTNITPSTHHAVWYVDGGAFDCEIRAK
ncbi:MAG: hypothetical protein H6672_03655 [Anaerolineaceae bacterium]|nr:hypothetical protein [Anaerolineaceae bacterium]